MSWKGCQLFAAAFVESVMEANNLGPVGTGQGRSLIWVHTVCNLGHFGLTLLLKNTSFFIYAVPQLDKSCV